MSNAVKISKPPVSVRKTSGKKVKKLSAKKDDDELTIEILQKAATEAFTEAAAKTMKVMGYNVVSKDGWIVKKYADGKIERISKLGNHHNKPIVLD